MPNFKELTPMFKKLGAVRPYYICLKIKEIHRDLYSNTSPSDAQPKVNQIWSLYQTLLESLHDYFSFLDFNFSILQEKGYQLSKNIDPDCKTNFVDIFSSLVLPDDLYSIVKDGRCFCYKINSEAKNENFDLNVEERKNEWKETYITPNQIIITAMLQIKKINKSGGDMTAEGKYKLQFWNYNNSNLSLA